MEHWGPWRPAVQGTRHPVWFGTFCSVPHTKDDDRARRKGKPELVLYFRQNQQNLELRFTICLSAVEINISRILLLLALPRALYVTMHNFSSPPVLRIQRSLPVPARRRCCSLQGKNLSFETSPALLTSPVWLLSTAFNLQNKNLLSPDVRRKPQYVTCLSNVFYMFLSVGKQGRILRRVYQFKMAKYETGEWVCILNNFSLKRRASKKGEPMGWVQWVKLLKLVKNVGLDGMPSMPSFPIAIWMTKITESHPY